MRDSGTEKRLEVEGEMASVIGTNDEEAGSLATDNRCFGEGLRRGKRRRRSVGRRRKSTVGVKPGEPYDR
jgi:hypothetical protein